MYQRTISVNEQNYNYKNQEHLNEQFHKWKSFRESSKENEGTFKSTEQEMIGTLQRASIIAVNSQANKASILQEGYVCKSYNL